MCRCHTGRRPPWNNPRMVEAEERSPAWLLALAAEREHIVAAVALGQQRWREVGEVIAQASDADDARRRIAAKFGLDDVQSAAVLDTQFRRLSGVDRNRISVELDELREEIKRLKDQIAANPDAARFAPAATPQPEGHRGWWGYERRE